MAAEFISNQQVILHEMLLPEIRQDIVLPELQTRVFNALCLYDIIFGHDALCHLQIILGFNNNIIKSLTSSIPMRSFPANIQGPQQLAQQLHLNEINPFCSPNDPQDSFALHNVSEPKFENFSRRLLTCQHSNSRSKLHSPFTRSTKLSYFCS